MRVHHLAVVVADLDLSERFYAGVLGLPVERRWADPEGRPRAVWLGLGEGAFLALERAASAGPLRSAEAPGWHCVSLAIAPSEREVWRARLAQRKPYQMARSQVPPITEAPRWARCPSALSAS